jgi:hypothetical protein
VDVSLPPAKLGLVFWPAPRPFIVSQPLGDLVFEVDRGVAVTSSTTTVPIVVVGRVVSLCRPSRRRLVTRWWMVLRARLAFSQRF